MALTIAGSDSGGGAGIQADLRTFHQFGVFGTCAITAITAQNTTGVTAIHPVPIQHVRAQIDAVAKDLAIAAAAELRTHALQPYVMDPVMVATSGDRLLEPRAEQAFRDSLLPLSTLITPNLEEAEILTGFDVRSHDQMARAARTLVEAGAGAALVKGGHLEGDPIDLLWDGKQERIWRHRRIETVHTHGTGCTLSAAITASLALGLPLPQAVDRGIRFIARAIETAPGIGSGRGPVNHAAEID
ncbi:MAG: bifunctional hydroxymethylpyrimidine kinase/phosphomethylpyrimidine kinase [Longimicrobiales bacterium]